MIPGISYYYKMDNLPLDIWFLSVGYEGVHEFEDVRLVVDVGQRIVVHGF